ncbi:MAG: hypothetical protein LBO63_04760 [Oscillospiraceae bacterium]|jgi:hypothetical protein|nr:hypothetical protein [Oscillospiraceae bacterium]
MTWQSPEKRSRSVHFHLWASEEEVECMPARELAPTPKKKNINDFEI